MHVQLAPRIIADRRILSGKPVIEGTRVPVDLILGKLAGGMSFEEVASEYEIDRDDILAALSYAANVLATDEVRATA
jgi:uncharacterized protein (DUF433 family)